MSTEPESLNGSNGSVIRVAIFSMVVSLLVFLFMGLLGLVMRLDQGGLLTLNSELYYQVMTLHGAGMTSSILLLCMGAYAAVASKRMRFSPLMLWNAVLLYTLGDALVIISVVFGGFAAGYTVLYPLPFFSQGAWTLWSALAFAAGYAFIAIGLLVYSIHILTTARRQFGGFRNLLAWNFIRSGGKVKPSPEVTPVDIVAPTVAVIGIACALEGAIYVLALYAQAGGLVSQLNTLIMYNLLYSFAHDYVNLQIYLAAGVVYATLPLLVGREWHLSWPTAVAWNVIVFFVLGAYFHHIYEAFVNPAALNALGQAVTDLSVLPSLLVTILGGLTLVYRSRIKWTVPAMMLFVGLWGWAFGGIGGILDSVIPINQIMHNTMWVPAHFHTYMILGSAIFTIGYLYFLVKDLGGIVESAMSRIAVWFYVVGGTGLVLSFFVAGAVSIPRRYSAWLPQWQGFSLISIPFVVILGIGAGWLALEIVAGLGPAWRGTFRNLAGAPNMSMSPSPGIPLVAAAEDDAQLSPS